VDSHKEDAMIELIQNRRFKQASLATADRLLRVIEHDASAFSSEDRERRPRLTTSERLERLRQRAVTR
jgi:hypothetical protein